MQNRSKPRVSRRMFWTAGPAAVSMVLVGVIAGIATDNPILAVVGVAVAFVMLLWVMVLLHRDAVDAERTEEFRKESEALGDLDILPGLWADEPRFETNVEYLAYGDPQRGETRYIDPKHRDI